MQKACLAALIFLCFLASSCTSTVTQPPASVTAIPSATLTLTPSPTLTATPQPTFTPAPPTITPLPTIPTFTPTFDVRTIVTATPAPKAECPIENPNLTADFPVPDINKCNAGESESCYVLGTANEIMAFLQKGGGIKSVIKRLNQANPVNDYLYRDVTGDSVPELMFIDFGSFPVFNIIECMEGQYKLEQPSVEPPVRFGSLQDMNLNGIPEIVLYGGECTGSGCFGVYTFEWDGSTFNNLSPDAGIFGLDKFTIEDIDHNGTKELILKGDRPGMGIYSSYVPWRLKTDVYMWNGQAFNLALEEFASPDYRFQAIQDADRYVLAGNYQKSFALYQETVFSNKLSWWSLEREHYFIQMDPWRDPKETPLPTPIPDTTEYPKLAAYAYYRMVILHTFLGEMDAAKIQYATLQEKFPEGNPGHPYVEMANAFWNAYQTSDKMYDACAAAIAYADTHPEILTVLGSDYHGVQNHIYVPADVCPFR